MGWVTVYLSSSSLLDAIIMLFNSQVTPLFHERQPFFIHNDITKGEKHDEHVASFSTLKFILIRYACITVCMLNETVKNNKKIVETNGITI